MVVTVSVRVEDLEYGNKMASMASKMCATQSRKSFPASQFEA